MAALICSAFLLALMPAGLVAAERFRATTHHSFEDVEHWRKVFDDPEREAWQQPDRVIAALDLAPGMTVADLGAGTGYFSSRLCRALGNSGLLFSVETEAKLLEYLRGRAEKEGCANLIPVLASVDNPRLPPASLDLLFIVDTFHHIDSRLEYFRSAASTLKPKGRLAVIDWKQGELPEGPSPKHKVSAQQVISEMNDAGYRLAVQHDFLKYQYFLVFTVKQ